MVAIGTYCNHFIFVARRCKYLRGLNFGQPFWVWLQQIWLLQRNKALHLVLFATTDVVAIVPLATQWGVAFGTICNDRCRGNSISCHAIRRCNRHLLQRIDTVAIGSIATLDVILPRNIFVAIRSYCHGKCAWRLDPIATEKVRGN
jgi:hypothetical protein